MKKHYVLYILFAFLCLGFFACKEEKPLAYEDDPAIYIMGEVSPDKKFKDYIFDSTYFSFFYSSNGTLRDTVFLEIETMGNLSDYDRPILIEQTNVGQANAAQAGVHYIAFNNPEVSKYFNIPANQPNRILPIIFLKDPSLESSTYELQLAVKSNEHFREGIDSFRNYMIKVTSMPTKPALWESFKTAFGLSWGPVKMKFIVEATGYTNWSTVPDYSYLTYLKSLVNKAFSDYNKNNPNNPLKEADGTEVSFTS